MAMQFLRLRASTLLAGVALLLFTGWAYADPPSRVARLGAITGAVSFSPAGETDWVQATVNRPLGTGDRLWADADGRTEIQAGGTMVRMGANTGVSVLNLNDTITQLQLTEGTLNVRVSRLAGNQAVEVDTPNLAFTLRKPGEYRISVDPDGHATDILVRKGQGEAYGEGAAYLVDTRQGYRFAGTGLRNYQYLAATPPDAFDRWASQRNRAYDQSTSARYVSPDVIGYQDLDANGTWRSDTNYGKVWVPSRVAAGWAPYRDGHWAWVDPWGWTWVDDAPWGFAVSHYGRWAHLRDSWAWVPGPVRTQAWYAPALVAFVGGNAGNVAWFPLAPREVYRPSYTASRAYVENVNRSNTVINTTVINNTYNTTNVTNVVYANRQVPGAVVVVAANTFAQSQPVARSVVRATPEMAASAPVALAPPVAPTERSVRGGSAGAGGRPPQRVFERPAVALSAPPAAHAGFAAQQQQLAANPGKPLDDAARKNLKPAAVALAVAAITVVAQAQAAPPTKAPPPPAPPASAPSAPAASAAVVAPAAAVVLPAPVPAALPAASPASAASALPPNTKPAQATTPNPVVPPRAVPSAPAAAPAAAAPPRAQAASELQVPGARANREQPARPASSPQAAKQAAPPLPVPVPQVAAPASRPAPPAQATAKPAAAPPPKQAEAAPGAAAPKAPPPSTAETQPAAPQAAAPVTRPVPPPQQAPKPVAAPAAIAPAPAPAPPPPPAIPPNAVPPAPPAPPAAVAPPPKPAPPAAAPAAQAQRPPKPEPPAPAKPVEAQPPAAAGKPPSPAPQAQAAQKAEPRAQAPKPAASKPGETEKEKDAEEKKREEEKRKPKG